MTSPSLPYIFIPSDTTDTPLVVSVPHCGTRIPARYAADIVADKPTMLRDADLHVDRLYENTPRLGGSLLSATISRYVLDLNRGPEEVEAAVCPDFRGARWPNSRSIVWRLATTGEPVQRRALTLEQLEERITTIHRPYHERLARLLAEKREKFGFAVLVEAHSMPSLGKKTHPDPGSYRADIVPGDNGGKTCAPSLSALVVEHFEAYGMRVAPNTPYAGGWNTRHYGQPDDGVHAIQIEINRNLYLHEQVPCWAGAPAFELQGLIDQLLEKLVTYRP